MVAEDDGQRHLLCLERVGKRHIARQLAVVAAAGGLQRPRVVADDVKDPERVRRTREVARQLAVTCRKERDDARDVRPQVGSARVLPSICRMTMTPGSA